MSSRFYRIGTAVGVCIIIAIVALVATAKNRDKKIAEENQSMIMSSANLVEENISADIKKVDNDKSAKAKMNDTNITKSEPKKTAEVNKNATTSSKKNTVATNTKANKEEARKEPVFKQPVKGEIVQDYAKDKLVYSQTLGEWVTHTGIDIRANKTTVVTASADGKVRSIKNDPRYGLTVVIEHNDGFSTVYANLLTAEFVKIGESVKVGQTIGTVGNTAAFEILDEPHLHFEILKDNEPIDPNMYLKN